MGVKIVFSEGHSLRVDGLGSASELAQTTHFFMASLLEKDSADIVPSANDRDSRGT